MTTSVQKHLCLAALTLCALTAPLSAQTTLRVPKDFETIQEAVDEAVDGDTIVISKGDYFETVVISDFKGLTVIGKGRPVIRGPLLFLGGGGGGGGQGNLLISDSNQVLVKGLVVRESFATDSLSVSSSNNVTFQSCRVEQPFGSTGISVSSSNNVLIDRCRITGSSPDAFSEGDQVTGISISSSTEVAVVKARIRDVSDDGVSVASSGPVTLEKCRIQNIGDDGVIASSNVTGGLLFIDRCRLSDIDDEGIEISGPMTDLHVFKTRLTRINDDGVVAMGRAVTLDKVSVTDCEHDAFNIAPIATLPTLEEGSSVDGPVLVTNCRAKRIEQAGLRLIADGAVVTNFRISSGEEEGVVIDDSNGVSMTKVRVSKVLEGGLDADNVINSSFVDFRITKADPGVSIGSGSENNMFENFRVKASSNDGFEIFGDNNDFLKNRVTKSEDYGFRVDSEGNTFTENRAKGSGEADLLDNAGKGANTYIDNKFGTIEGL